MTNLTLQSRVCSIFCSLNLSNSTSARTLSANNLRRRHLRLSLQDGQYEQLTLLCPPCTTWRPPAPGSGPPGGRHSGTAPAPHPGCPPQTPSRRSSLACCPRIRWSRSWPSSVCCCHCLDATLLVSPQESSVTTLSSPPAPSLPPPVPPSPVQLAFVHLWPSPASPW